MAVPICCENRVGTLAEGRRGYRPLGRDDPERRLDTSTRSGSGSTIDPYSPGAPFKIRGDRPRSGNLGLMTYEYRIFIEGAEDSSVSNFSSEKLWDGASFRANKPGHDVNGRMLVIYRSRLPRQRAGGTGAVACRQAALEPGAYRRRQSRPCRRLRLAWRGCEGDRHRARRANRPPDHRSRDHARNPQDHPGLLANGDDDRAVRADEH
jgi:hypothetical protein